MIGLSRPRIVYVVVRNPHTSRYLEEVKNTAFLADWGRAASTPGCPSENKTLLWHIHTHSKIACKIEVNLCAPHPLTYYSVNIKMSSESIQQTSFIFRIIVILSIACKILYVVSMFISGINFVIHNKEDFLKACPWSKAVIFLYRTWSCWISLERQTRTRWHTAKFQPIFSWW